MGLAGTRLTYRHSAFYYRHRDGRWEHVGTDVHAAKIRAALYNDPTGVYGTTGYWLDMFLVDCEKRVKDKDLSARTLSDYVDNVSMLKPYFGAMLPESIAARHVQVYLEMQAAGGRPVRGNREVACLSSALSWYMRNQKTTMKFNPWNDVAAVSTSRTSKASLSSGQIVGPLCTWMFLIPSSWHFSRYRYAPGSLSFQPREPLFHSAV